ncbi:N-acetylmuramoyl-L-alanine amidase family protein [Chengkuizengella axinellae]|uniref:N-acetylmuramoyl-L-alanine amidase family protein n=1 Tax=Chengkuizengella axinellae TaxID=3064388 RepID=A0ABT9IX06_9BACL|nr:N-acetylmuramoyl-L-alanine amidase family protein [Chengkuizengella sp. 2205SS18-9]MDP5273891.1 N-acetylmuramoyl-L-alanine amidase family protein [Chengkuizengella sp. 2205SS18-9]
MKRISILLSVLLFLNVFPSMIFADDSSISLYVNGEKSNDSPQKINGDLYIPFEFFIDELDAEVEWKSSNNHVNIQNKQINLDIYMDRSTAYLNGSTLEMKNTPKMIQGEVYLPIQIMSEDFGIKYIWDNFTQSIYVYKNKDGIQISSSKRSNPEPEPLVETNSSTGTQSTQSPEIKPESNLTSDNIVLQTNAGDPTLYEIEVLEDEIVFQGSTPLDYSSFYLPEPDRIVIDFEKSSFGPAFMDQESGTYNGVIEVDHPDVKSIRYAMFEDLYPRIVVDLHENIEYSMIGIPEDNQVKVLLGVTNTASQSNNNHPDEEIVVEDPFIIVIDPGHGGDDPGATGSVSSRVEKHFTLEFAQKLYDLLDEDPYFQPYMTRNDDVEIELDDRAAYANELGADAFLSIHGNIHEKLNISGTETYYWSDQSYDLAQTIHGYVVEAAGLPDRELREVKYRVLDKTDMPAALLEIGYLSTKHDEDLMLTDDFQNRVAESIVEALRDFYLNE